MNNTDNNLMRIADEFEIEDLRKRTLELKRKNAKRRKYKKISQLLYILSAVFLIFAGIAAAYAAAYQNEAKKNARISEETIEIVNTRPENLQTVSIENEYATVLVAEPATENNIEESGLPVTEENSASLMKINRLRDAFANDDIIGCLRIDGTNIDYAVVQYGDNDFYLSYDLYGEKNTAGSIFMDFECDAQNLSSNTVIYGHNMRDGSMFHNLRYFAEEEFFAAHRFISLTTSYGETKWEIFSFYKTSPDFYYIQVKFPDTDSFAKLVSEMKSRSEYDTETTVGANDKILTLSTCAGATGDTRLVVNAKLVAEASQVDI